MTESEFSKPGVTRARIEPKRLKSFRARVNVRLSTLRGTLGDATDAGETLTGETTGDALAAAGETLGTSPVDSASRIADSAPAGETLGGMLGTLGTGLTGERPV